MTNDPFDNEETADEFLERVNGDLREIIKTHAPPPNKTWSSIPLFIEEPGAKPEPITEVIDTHKHEPEAKPEPKTEVIDTHKHEPEAKPEPKTEVIDTHQNEPGAGKMAAWAREIRDASIESLAKEIEKQRRAPRGDDRNSAIVACEMEYLTRALEYVRKNLNDDQWWISNRDSSGKVGFVKLIMAYTPVEPVPEKESASDY